MPEPTLTKCHEPFFAGGWISERKLDGERCVAACDNSGVSLRSRNLGLLRDEAAGDIVRET